VRAGLGGGSTLDRWPNDGAWGRYFVIDVFTDTPLEGNQLGVFPEAGALSSEQMLSLAREMSFSETVFALPPHEGGHVRVRIFTPDRELPFAGHPVLGCAFLVGSTLPGDVVRVETGIGVIPVELQRTKGRITFGRMRQPIPDWRPFGRVGELLAALGIERSGIPVEEYATGPLHVYVECDSEDAVGALSPNFNALRALGPVCASCFAGAGGSWKTRMFAPALGVFEDPATGSAAGPLAIHLARHGRIAFGEEIEIRQGSEIGRPSVLYARAAGSGDRIERVEVGGCAVIVARGEFLLAELT
jgi:trans-2,3-dihydro-3-hydroxyanthranilate isomerase